MAGIVFGRMGLAILFLSDIGLAMVDAIPFKNSEPRFFIMFSAEHATFGFVFMYRGD